MPAHRSYCAQGRRINMLRNMIGCWSQIARKLQRCQLIFFDHTYENLSDKLHDRLDQVFADADLYGSEFVRFIPRLARADFDPCHGRADVYLDTLGFSGFNSCDAGDRRTCRSSHWMGNS